VSRICPVLGALRQQEAWSHRLHSWKSTGPLWRWDIMHCLQKSHIVLVWFNWDYFPDHRV
jgi:hypothetical protein